MILIVILIVMLFGLAPVGFGNEPGSPECADPVLAADITVDGCHEAGAARAWLDSPFPAWGCSDLDGSLLVEHGSGLVLVNPGTLVIRAVPFRPDVARFVERGWNRLEGVLPPPWHVEQSTDETGQRIVVYERQTGGTVFDVAFTRRIELSTAKVSSTGRFTLHVQANNIASEVTILDAQSSSARSLDIPHDARLAAFSIGVAFSPAETCAAISMERVDGIGPETWLLDLVSGDVRQVPVMDAFVVAWTRIQV